MGRDRGGQGQDGDRAGTGRDRDRGRRQETIVQSLQDLEPKEVERAPATWSGGNPEGAIGSCRPDALS